MKDMTSGPPAKLLFFFTLPLLLGNIFHQLYVFSDTWIVSKKLGKEALAGIGGSSGTLLFLIFGFASGMIGGLTAYSSQFFGAKNYRRVRQSIGTSIIITAIISVLITGLMVGFLDHFLRWLNTPHDSYQHAKDYLLILFGGTFISCFFLYVQMILRALGDSRTPLYFLMFFNLLNIGLNAFFVFVLQRGIAGVAEATIISQFVSTALCIVYALYRYKLLRLKWYDWRFDWQFYLKHLKMAMPMGFQFTVTSLGICVMQYYVNDFGTDAVAGASVASPLATIAISALFSIGVTSMTFTAQNYGARNLRRIRHGVRIINLAAIVFGAVLGMIMAVFAPQLIGIFMDEGTSTSVIEYGVQNIRITAPLYPILAVLIVFRNVLQGFGYANVSFMSGIAEMIVRAASVPFLAAWFGYQGAIACNPLAWTAAALLLVGCYIYALRKLYKYGIPEITPKGPPKHESNRYRRRKNKKPFRLYPLKN